MTENPKRDKRQLARTSKTAVPLKPSWLHICSRSPGFFPEDSWKRLETPQHQGKHQETGKEPKYMLPHKDKSSKNCLHHVAEATLTELFTAQVVTCLHITSAGFSNDFLGLPQTTSQVTICVQDQVVDPATSPVPTLFRFRFGSNQPACCWIRFAHPPSVHARSRLPRSPPIRTLQPLPCSEKRFEKPFTALVFRSLSNFTTWASKLTKKETSRYFWPTVIPTVKFWLLPDLKKKHEEIFTVQLPVATTLPRLWRPRPSTSWGPVSLSNHAIPGF